MLYNVLYRNWIGVLVHYLFLWLLMEMKLKFCLPFLTIKLKIFVVLNQYGDS